MKIFSNLLSIIFVSLLTPLVVFGCMGGGTYIDPFLFIVLSYFLIVGFIYFKNYKRLLDNKWNFLQYTIILLVTIPSLFLVLSILNSFPFFPNFMLEKPMSRLPRLPGGTINENLINPILAAVAFFIVLVPLVFKKRWIYAWGIPSYLLIVIILYAFFGDVIVGILCADSANF